MPAAFEGEPLEIGFNPEFLQGRDRERRGRRGDAAADLAAAAGPAAAGRQRRLPLPRDADPPQRLRRPGRCWSPPSKRGRCAASSDVAGRAGGGDRQPDRPQRRRQDQPARGALLRPHRPLVSHPRPPRADPLRRPSSPAPRRRFATRTASSTACSPRSAAPRAGATCSTATPADPATWPGTGPPVAVFSPDRLALVKGPPAERRAHLDRFVAARWPSRAGLRQRYGQALAQRNALLAPPRRRARAGGDLDVWDATLAEAAAAADRRPRRGGGGAGAARSPPRPRELGLAGGGDARVRAARRGLDAEAIRAGLAERREADLRLGRTLLGPAPRRAEDLASADRSLRRYGSQGQQRAAPPGAALRRARGAARRRAASRRCCCSTT